MAVDLPPGFVLDKSPNAPTLPPGFVLDTPDKPGIGEQINTGVNWLGTQFAKGVTGALGAPSDLGNLGQRGVHALFEKVLGPAPAIPEYKGVTPGSQDINKVLFGTLGLPEVNAADNPALTVKMPLLGGREVNVGKFLDVIPQAVTGGAATGGTKAILPTVTSGLASEAAGQATAGTDYEVPARIAAALVGQRVGNRAMTPLPANLTPEQTRLRDISAQLIGEDKMSVGELTGRLRGVESAASRFPTSEGVMRRAADARSTALQGKAFEEAGVPNVNRVDPNSMGTAVSTANAEFNAAKQAMGPVDLNANFFNQAGQHVSNYVGNNPPSGIVPAVERRFNDFVGKVGAGQTQLSGPEYQQFRKGLNDAAQNTADPAARKALQGIRTALDDAAEASSKPEATAAFKEARRHWGNLKTIENAVLKNGPEAQTAGNLSPNALSSALKSFQGTRFGTTTGGMNDIAAATRYLSDMRPNSGTPSTAMMQNLMTGGTVLGGGGAGFLAGGPAGAAIGAAGAMLPNLIARALTGQPGGKTLKNYLANQAGAKLTNQERLIQALVGAGAAR